MRCAVAMLTISILAVTGCDVGPKSAIGFKLPDGNAAAGQVAFINHQCTACHSVKDVDLPAPETPGTASVVLGGEVTAIKTYGQLVTSIINPTHTLAPGYPISGITEDGDSLMRVYNDVMTVRELTDLVMFLQSHYDVVVPPYYYRPY